MSRSPPRYSLDEGERLATGTAENHPLLSTEHESGKVDARDDKSQPLEQISRGFGILDTEMGMRYGYGFGVGSGAGPSSGAAGGSGDASTAEGAGAAAPAPRALYGKLTTLYSLHPTYMVPGGTETCIGILGRDRQDTLRIIRQAFPILDNYPSERIMLKVSRSAMGVGERVENPTTGQMTIAPTEDFDHLERYPPDCEKTRNRLHELVEVMDDAWGFLQEMPPGRVRVLVRPTEEDKKRAWRQYWRGLHIFLGLTGGPMLIAIIWVMIAAALGRL